MKKQQLELKAQYGARVGLFSFGGVFCVCELSDEGIVTVGTMFVCFLF